MKKIIAILLSMIFILSGCQSTSSTAETTAEAITSTEAEQMIDESSYTGVDDPIFLRDLETATEKQLVQTLDSKIYRVNNIQTEYKSKEYMEEIAYNSLANDFFGYTLSDLERQFQDKRYIFTLGEDGNTAVEELKTYVGDYKKALKNVMIGAGVILICVTVTVISTNVNMGVVFAVSTKAGAMKPLLKGAVGAISAGIVEGMETGDMERVIKKAATEGSEKFKWAALSGVTKFDLLLN